MKDHQEHRDQNRGRRVEHDVGGLALVQLLDPDPFITSGNDQISRDKDDGRNTVSHVFGNGSRYHAKTIDDRVEQNMDNDRRLNTLIAQFRFAKLNTHRKSRYHLRKVEMSQGKDDRRSDQGKTLAIAGKNIQKNTAKGIFFQ